MSIVRNLEEIRVLEEIETLIGFELFAHQDEAITEFCMDPEPFPRHCLYHRTGAGKTVTALGMLRAVGWAKALVIAPPSTHKSWEEMAEKLGISIEAISHAKFRQKGYKLDKNTPLIADEVHMFGGHRGQGWVKLERAARGLKAPVILASATPNYNDAERVYCIGKILDPPRFKGGYVDFLYRECLTVQNHFSMTPDVEGFRNYADAHEFLTKLKNVHVLEDNGVWTETTFTYNTAESRLTLREYSYDRRNHRMVASAMERKHLEVNYAILDDHGFLHGSVIDALITVTEGANKPVLIYCDHSTIAEAASRTFVRDKVQHEIITGKTSKKKKEEIVQRFRGGEIPFLLGTASLATGTDGLDKVCDLLVILDDTDDDSLRRQLIGRILPRGLSDDQTEKQVVKLVPFW